MARMKTGPRFVLIGVTVVALMGGARYAVNHGYVNSAPPMPVSVPSSERLPDLPPPAPVAQQSQIAPMAVRVPVSSALPDLPPSGVVPASASSASPTIRVFGMPWNGNSSLIYANGGATTAQGSLMQQHGVNLQFARDDGMKMQAALVALAADACTGKLNTKAGVHFAMIMGDYSAAFLRGVNQELAALNLGPDCQAEIVGFTGRSDGEDKLMGPPAWLKNPKLALGSVVICVIKDGDWNIMMNWAWENHLPVNPNFRTYNPNAINVMAADDFLDAAAKYNLGTACEDRPVTGDDGRVVPNTQPKHVCGNAVATWYPGDSNIVRNRGGLVTIVDTHAYRSQMVTTLIGIRHWNERHRNLVTGMLSATFAASDIINTNDGALREVSAMNAQIHGELSAQQWYDAFHGKEETDKEGNRVRIGGSAVSNLADNLRYYGLTGGQSIFAAVYRKFGDFVVAQYPADVPDYLPLEQVLNTSYLLELAKQVPPEVRPAPEQIVYKQAPITQRIGSRDFQINFDTGTATLRPEATAVLNEILQDLLVNLGSNVEITGHTDNTGSKTKNQQLSEDRAFAVKTWLESHAPEFMKKRIVARGFGDSLPKASNGSVEGRAQNRRVEITVGATS